MKGLAALPAIWAFHYWPSCGAHKRYAGASLRGRDALPQKPNPRSLASRALAFCGKCFHSLASCLGAGEVQECFGKRLTELQRAVTEPEGCQDEGNMGRIHQHRSQGNISRLALIMLCLLICSLQTS